MRWYQFIWALALLGLTEAARHGSSPRHSEGRYLSNAERMKRGLPLNSPKAFHDPSRTHGTSHDLTPSPHLR